MLCTCHGCLFFCLQMFFYFLRKKRKMIFSRSRLLLLQPECVSAAVPRRRSSAQIHCHLRLGLRNLTPMPQGGRQLVCALPPKMSVVLCSSSQQTWKQDDTVCYFSEEPMIRCVGSEKNFQARPWIRWRLIPDISDTCTKNSSMELTVI